MEVNEAEEGFFNINLLNYFKNNKIKQQLN